MHRIKSGYSLVAVGLLLLFLLKSSEAQNPDGVKIPGLFSSDKILEITIISDFKNLLANRADTNLKIHARVIVDQKPEDTISCELSPRGKFRRKAANCEFPPLRMKFKKSKISNTDFEGLKNLKMVTHCNTVKSFKDVIFSEYLVYRLWDHCSDIGFQTRLFRARYVFKNQPDSIIYGYGFFIEDNDDMAKRLDSEVVKDPGFGFNELNRQALMRLAMFQYMIGNIDYSATMLHNCDAIKLKTIPGLIPVPYDFDYSEMVFPPYADLVFRYKDQQSGKIFKSICPTSTEVDAAVTFFGSRKSAFRKEIRKCKHLSGRKKRQMLHYLHDFYRIIHNEQQVKSEFYIQCDEK